MIGAIGNNGVSPSYYSPADSKQKDVAAPDNKKNDEVTTVNVSCKKNHKHTQACPHTTSTRPANNTDGKGNNLDVFA